MVAKNPTPFQDPAENMLQQAIDAIRAEQFARARDILTTLLQTDQRNPDYWIWMSATMETQKERLYCLQTAYKLDPANTAARHGLRIMGFLPENDPIQPFPMNHPRAWKTKTKQAEAKKDPKLNTFPALRFGALISLFAITIIVLSLIGLGIASQLRFSSQSPIETARPTVTPYATNSNNTIPQVSTSKPMIIFLSTPYTPTPVYAATPHSQAASDSYKSAMRAYRNGQWENVAFMMAQVATLQPGSADAIYFIAEANRLSGKYSEAINLYKTAIEVNSKFAPSYLGRAQANFALNPKNDVIDDLNKAISLDQNYAEAYTERGLYYLRNKDFKSAQNNLEIASGLNTSPITELTLARVFLAQGQNGAAILTAKHAIQLDVNNLDSYLVLGVAYNADGQKENAIDVLESYLKYSQDNAQAFMILGKAYYNNHNYSKAEENLLQSLRLDQNNADNYFWLGQTYLALKDNSNALLNYQKARELNPISFEISEGLAFAFMAAGEFNNSYIVISKVEKTAGKPALRARFLFIRAQSLEQLNQPVAAMHDWNEILGLPGEATSDEMRQKAIAQIAELGKPTTTNKPANIATTHPGIKTLAPPTPTPTISSNSSSRSTQPVRITSTP